VRASACARSPAGALPGAFRLGLCLGDREAGADRQCRELIDRVAAGAPVGKLLVAEALRHARVPSSPQSTRIVQRKRRPTSGADKPPAPFRAQPFRRHTEQPSRPNRARPDAGSPCTTRSTGRGRRQRCRAHRRAGFRFQRRVSRFHFSSSSTISFELICRQLNPYLPIRQPVMASLTHRLRSLWEDIRTVDGLFSSASLGAKENMVRRRNLRSE
jgi:hypothetical protein